MPWRETPGERDRACAEEPMVIRAPDGDLVAIYTPPADAAPPAGLCVVHLDRPRSRRNRIWVRGARWLAVRGFAACRFDYHGNGDSSGARGFFDPSMPYQSDLVAVLRHLREVRNHRQFILTGLCFDARTALSSMLVEPEWIRGIAFISAPATSLQVVSQLDAARGRWAGLWRAVNNPENWRRLADPKLWKGVDLRLRAISGRLDEPTAALALEESFVDAFNALTRSTARALFLFGEADKELFSFEGVLRDLWPTPSAEARARLVLEVWPGEVHDGFRNVVRQKEIVERVLDWVVTFHPSASAGIDIPDGGFAAPLCPAEPRLTGERPS